jgi:hypothetical protein
MRYISFSKILYCLLCGPLTLLIAEPGLTKKASYLDKQRFCLETLWRAGCMRRSDLVRAQSVLCSLKSYNKLPLCELFSATSRAHAPLSLGACSSIVAFPPRVSVLAGKRGQLSARCLCISNSETTAISCYELACTDLRKLISIYGDYRFFEGEVAADRSPGSHVMPSEHQMRVLALKRQRTELIEFAGEEALAKADREYYGAINGADGINDYVEQNIAADANGQLDIPKNN